MFFPKCKNAAENPKPWKFELNRVNLSDRHQTNKRIETTVTSNFPEADFQTDGKALTPGITRLRHVNNCPRHSAITKLVSPSWLHQQTRYCFTKCRIGQFLLPLILANLVWLARPLVWPINNHYICHYKCWGPSPGCSGPGKGSPGGGTAMHVLQTVAALGYRD